MELYYQTGPALIKKIKERGHDIFLDLKLHDIVLGISCNLRSKNISCPRSFIFLIKAGPV
jgi:hypothetical protein